MKFSTCILQTILLAGTALGAPTATEDSPGSPVERALMARATVAHDSLNPIPDRIQGGGVGRSILRFQPLLHIAHGCQPYPALNDNGQTSGGLQDSGSSSGGCRDTNKGQTYARGAWRGTRYGIMYAWYWPKDHPIDGNVAGGHRHDWESVVVWLDNPNNQNPVIVGGAASGHGSFKKTASPQRNGNNVKVEYFTNFPTNHELQFTNTVGRSYWISDWDMMPKAAKDALNANPFGSANCPFNDGNFWNNLDKAMV